MKSYLVRVGLDYPGPDGQGRRAEPGEVVHDLPASSVGWLLARGAIEDAPEHNPPAPPRRKKTTKGGDL